MNGKEREKFIRSDSEFRGFVIAHLEGLKEKLNDHLDSEMEQLKMISERIGNLEIRLVGIENWKLKVTTISGVIGTILGFILSKINL